LGERGRRDSLGARRGESLFSRENDPLTEVLSPKKRTLPRQGATLSWVSAELSLTSLTSIILDQKYVHVNTVTMSITPKAIQDLLDELEASKQSRLRAWSVLQRLRMVLSEVGNVAIPPPA
jgi:hypothetical protein